MNRMKMTACLLTALLCLVPTIPAQDAYTVQASAAASALASGKCGASLTWSLESSGVLTISGSGSMYNYHSVTNKSPWTSNQSKIKTVKIGSGVTSIGSDAFNGCTALTSVTIPSSVTSLGDGVFQDCSALTSITLPGSIKAIPEGAFWGCSSLTSLTIPSGVTTIEGNAFCSCSSLLTVTIPNSVTNLGPQAFSQCSSLACLTIPGGVTAIGDYTFWGCKNLNYLTIMNASCEIYVVGDSISGSASVRGYSGSTAQTFARKYGYTFVPIGSACALGDLNDDSDVNASDAARLLMAAACQGATGVLPLPEEQRKAADVNKDGKVNASDAANVLMYSAAKGSGYKGTLENYLK